MAVTFDHSAACRVHDAPTGEYVHDDDCDCGAVIRGLRSALLLRREQIDDETCDSVDADGRRYQSASLTSAIEHADRVLGVKP